MTNVIGPFNKRQWKTLRMLRASIKQMRAANDPDLLNQIATEQQLYDTLLAAHLNPEELQQAA